MLEKNYSLYFQDKSCIIVDNAGCELMTVRMKEKSFPIKWKETNFYATDVDDSTLWHKRFGHFHHTALKHLHLKGLAQGMPTINEGKTICQACQFGKQSRLPFPVNKAWRASEKVQLIHTNVCRPMKTPTLNGSKYFILFIDDFTRMCWVYFMK